MWMTKIFRTRAAMNKFIEQNKRMIKKLPLIFSIMFFCSVVFVSNVGGQSQPPPSVDGVIVFLSEDAIDENNYIPEKYVCWNFAKDLVSNARNKGFFVSRVYISFESMAHEIVVFITSSGLLYIEPQNDMIYSAPMVGHKLCYNDGSFCSEETVLDFSFISWNEIGIIWHIPSSWRDFIAIAIR